MYQKPTSSNSNDSSLESKWHNRMWHHIDDSVVEEILCFWIRYYCSLVDRGLGERERRGRKGERGREGGREES